MKKPNHVELISFSGGDTTHANAAWVSTQQELTQDKLKRVPELLKFLAEHDHGTPFEHSSISFRVRSELATHIQFLKHRVGVSINSESARYKELSADTFYLPDDWPSELVEELEQYMEDCHSFYHKLTSRLTDLMGRQRAKETSRFVLPYAHQITYIVTFNFRSFVHFVQLRNSENAQREIADIARRMVKLVSDTHSFRNSLKAFNLT